MKTSFSRAFFPAAILLLSALLLVGMAFQVLLRHYLQEQTLEELKDNGTTIAGTEPETLSPEAKLAFETADVILSKGQANVETLYGCGKNIYYIFLIKCQRFVDYFQKEKLTPMLLRDKRQR